MKFVDSFNLPAPLKRALEWQSTSHQTDADITCTSLIDSPLLFHLKKRYGNEITVEYADKLWMLYGTIAHSILENHSDPKAGEHVECKVATMIAGWKVEAKLDFLLEGDCLTDYKFCSVWTTADGVKMEWERQLNVGLWLMRHDMNNPKIADTGQHVKKLQICALYRDWAPRIADKFPAEVQTLEVPVWSETRAKAYIEERVALHQAVAKNPEAVPPICSDSERWMDDFAVMSRKNPGRAMKAKIKTREEAEQWMEKLGGDYIREAKPRRCLRSEMVTFPPRQRCYCDYGNQGFCPWWDADKQETRETPVPLKPVASESCLDDPDHMRKDGPNL